MSPEQFHKQLLKLIKQAYKRGLCPGCAVRELLAASEAIAFLARLSSEDLASHGIPGFTLELLEEVQREHLH